MKQKLEKTLENPNISKILWLCAFLSPILFSVLIFILGFITPGYSHLNHTISRLAIEKYGWLQKLNFLQFGIGVSLMGLLFWKLSTRYESKQIWKYSIITCALVILIESIFPTDPIENVRFSLNLYTPNGFIHFSAILIFFMLSPLGVHRLKKSLKSEYKFRHLSNFTAHMGIIVCSLCLVWMVFFVLGIFLPYRGIFQKIIALAYIYWHLTMLLSIRNIASGIQSKYGSYVPHLSQPHPRE